MRRRNNSARLFSLRRVSREVLVVPSKFDVDQKKTVYGTVLSNISRNLIFVNSRRGGYG